MKSKDNGVFVTLEGVEGAGKSTQCRLIKSELESKGIKVVLTREPGGTELAEGIRALLLNPALQVGAEEELLLMFAARNEHVVKVIRPALATGQWVVSDRFVDASYAYQGYGRGLQWQTIEYLEQLVVGDTRPNLTLMLDVNPEVGLQRAANCSAKDRIEKEDVLFFENIRKGYMHRADADAKRIKIVDANRSMAVVEQQIKSVMDEFKRGLLSA